MDGEHAIDKLLRFAESSNLCDDLADVQLTRIGRDVVRWAGIDDASRDEWLKSSDKAMDLALQVSTGAKPGKSDVKYPIIPVAALQFHARAYPAICSGTKVVKAKVTGRDDTGQKSDVATRVEQFMNYQLLDEMEGWEEHTDRLLLALPIEGCEFKKTYFDPLLGRNVSEWIRPKDFIVGIKTKSLAECPRMTHRLWFYPQEIRERQLSGAWRDVELNIGATETEEEQLQEFYEQHCLLDLDGDGYKEPYACTVHVKSEKVLRIVPNFSADDILARQTQDGYEVVKITRRQYFTKFAFIPSPDGGFYDLGFGHLLGKMSDAIDTTINQMIDAGTLANRQGGFVRDGVTVGGKRGPVTFETGEFKPIKVPSGLPISESMYQLRFPGPSPVLFNLLGMLTQGAKDISGIQDIMTGQQGQNEPATTTMARLEQGLKVFSAIFKRVYRGFTEEFRKIYELNAEFLQPTQYFRVLDDNSEGVITLQDFRNDGTDVQPVADPNIATTVQRMAKAELLMRLKGDPTLNVDEINKRFFDAAEVPNPEALVIPQEARPKPPQDFSPLEMELKSLRLQDEAHKIRADTLATYAKALESIANAEAKEQGIQLDQYRASLEALQVRIDGIDKGRTTGMEKGESDEGSAEPPEGVSNEFAPGPAGTNEPDDTPSGDSEQGVVYQGQE